MRADTMTLVGACHEELERLPYAYARALRLRARGLPDLAIAHDLGVPHEAVSTLLRVADAKLRESREEIRPPSPGGRAPSASGPGS